MCIFPADATSADTSAASAGPASRRDATAAVPKSPARSLAHKLADAAAVIGHQFGEACAALREE